MPRRKDAQLQYDALALEGGLLPPEWLARVAALDAPDQAPADYGIPRGLALRDEIARSWRIAEALWADFAAARAHPETSAAFARALLRDVLAFRIFSFSLSPLV